MLRTFVVGDVHGCIDGLRARPGLTCTTQPYMEAGPRRSRYATGMDRGRCFGNKLCAAGLTPGGEPDFVMVDARQRYARSSWE